MCSNFHSKELLCRWNDGTETLKPRLWLILRKVSCSSNISNFKVPMCPPGWCWFHGSSICEENVHENWQKFYLQLTQHTHTANSKCTTLPGVFRSPGSNPFQITRTHHKTLAFFLPFLTTDIWKKVEPAENLVCAVHRNCNMINPGFGEWSSSRIPKGRTGDAIQYVRFSANIWGHDYEESWRREGFTWAHAWIPKNWVLSTELWSVGGILGSSVSPTEAGAFFIVRAAVGFLACRRRRGVTVKIASL